MICKTFDCFPLVQCLVGSDYDENVCLLITGEVLAYGEYVVMYVAFDAANNTGNCTFHVAVTRKQFMFFFLTRKLLEY
jgi:hypothetical protein